MCIHSLSPFPPGLTHKIALAVEPLSAMAVSPRWAGKTQVRSFGPTIALCPPVLQSPLTNCHAHFTNRPGRVAGRRSARATRTVLCPSGGSAPFTRQCNSFRGTSHATMDGRTARGSKAQSPLFDLEGGCGSAADLGHEEFEVLLDAP